MIPGGKPPGLVILHAARPLLDERRALKTVVAVADRVEDGLAERALVERRNVAADHAVDEAVHRVPQVHQPPQLVIDVEECVAQLDSLRVADLVVGVAVLEDDLGAAEVAGQ